MGLSLEGERILDWAKQTVAAWEGLRQEASSARAHLNGTLRLGAIPTTIPIVPFLTGPYRVAYPEMHQLVKSLSAEEIIRGLDDFDLDLGLTYLEDQRLKVSALWPLFRERYVLLAKNSQTIGNRTEISWAEAAALPLCLLTENMQNRASSPPHSGAPRRNRSWSSRPIRCLRSTPTFCARTCSASCRTAFELVGCTARLDRHTATFPSSSARSVSSHTSMILYRLLWPLRGLRPKPWISKRSLQLHAPAR